jgi:hypothetical protein
MPFPEAAGLSVLLSKLMMRSSLSLANILLLSFGSVRSLAAITSSRSLFSRRWYLH